MTIEELGKRVDAAMRLNKRIDNYGAEARVYLNAEFDGIKAAQGYRITSTFQRITGDLVVLLEPVPVVTCSPVSVLREHGALPPA